MPFKGRVLSVTEMLAAADVSPERAQRREDVSVRHTAARNLASLPAGFTDLDAWRYGVLQTLDDYASTRTRAGASVAAQVFDDVPQPTGSVRVDAAIASLAEHLADRDGWRAPAWVNQADRYLSVPWYLDSSPLFKAEADAAPVPAFARHGVRVSPLALERA